MADAHKNFAVSLVATAPSPASSGTSLVVTASDGTKFPSVPFNATIWPATVNPTAANAEIVRVTNISTDTLTITRAQESSSARTVVVGDQIAATITAKTLTDVEAVHVSTDTIWDAAGDLAVGSGADTAARMAKGTALQRLRTNAAATGLEWSTDFDYATGSCDSAGTYDFGPAVTSGGIWFGEMVYADIRLAYAIFAMGATTSGTNVKTMTMISTGNVTGAGQYFAAAAFTLVNNGSTTAVCRASPNGGAGLTVYTYWRRMMFT